MSAAVDYPGLSFPLTRLKVGVIEAGVFLFTHQSDTSLLENKYQTANGQALTSYNLFYPNTILVFSLIITIPALGVATFPYTSTFTLKLGSIDNNVFNEIQMIRFPFSDIESSVFKQSFTVVVKTTGKATVLSFTNLFVEHSSPKDSLAIRFEEDRSYINKSFLGVNLDQINTFELSSVYLFYRNR